MSISSQYEEVDLSRRSDFQLSSIFFSSTVDTSKSAFEWKLFPSCDIGTEKKHNFIFEMNDDLEIINTHVLR